MAEDELRALVFFSLMVVIVALIFVNHSFSSSLLRALSGLNLPMTVVVSVVTFTLAVSILCPVRRSIFHFGPIHADDLGFTFAAGATVLILLEFIKALWREQRPSR